MKFIFIPFSIAGGLLGGLLGKKLFQQIWGLIDSEEPPDAKIKEATWPKVIAATAIEGAVFRATRAVIDRGSRHAFENLTGTWPGQERPEPE